MRDDDHREGQAFTSTRRRVIAGALAGAAGTLLSRAAWAAPAARPPLEKLAAKPPKGFSPLSAPGRIVHVKKADCLQHNVIYPKPEDAKAMLERAMKDLTGEKNLVHAVSRFVHKDDKVCVKVNGIAGRNMGTNKELVLPFVEAMIAAGVPAESITVLEQYNNFLAGTRINAQNVPKGVKTAVHLNEDATMEYRMIPGTGVRTKFVRVLTESTAVINFALIKDHSICGFTGQLKNMTHGCTINPHDFHSHHASPQIAMLYAQDVIRSRVRLNIMDGYKVIAHGGPKDKYPEYRVPHESLYVSTDPVALDALGWEIVDKERKKFKLRSLEAERRPPAYIQTAHDLGLGIALRSRHVVESVTL